MRTLTRITLAATAALTLFAALTGTAAALRSLQLSGPATKAIIARELRFGSTEVEAINLRCNVTLTINQLTIPIPKVAGTIIGNVLNVAIDERNCVGGTARILPREGTTTLTRVPWNIKYVSISGRLPEISRVNLKLEGAEFLVEVFGGRCLYKGEPTGGAPVTERTLTVREITATRAETSVPLFQDLRGLITCPRTGYIEGGFTFERTLTIRLL